MTDTMLPAVPAEAGLQTADGFETLQRIATMFSKSTLVPKDYQNNLPNCAIAVQMALRMKADPLMVIQNLYIVHGRPGWSSQFLIACFNQCGRFSSIKYVWGGEPGKDSWSCVATATELESGEVIRGAEVSIKLAKAEGWYKRNGSKWQTIPQLMLQYRAAAFLVRTHAPELAMGLATVEESRDINGEATLASPRSVAAITAQLDGDVIDANEPVPDELLPNSGELLLDLLDALAECETVEQLEAIGNDERRLHLDESDSAILTENLSNALAAMSETKTAE